MSNDHVSNLMKGHMESLAAEGKRADGRGINEFREVKIVGFGKWKDYKFNEI